MSGNPDTTTCVCKGRSCSSCGQSPHHGRCHDEEAKWEPPGLDPPSNGGLAVRWGRGHSTETEDVTRADGRAVHRMTFKGKSDLSWGKLVGSKIRGGRQLGSSVCK